MTGEPLVTMVAHEEEAAERAADVLATALDAARTVHGVAHASLAGGSTPLRAYELLGERLPDWSDVHFWFGDERCVPPDHEHSNYGMAKRALLERLEGAAPTVRRIAGERGPREGAVAYERTLRESFGDGTPTLDLLLLGLGPDAHCASLFPRDEALAEQERLAVGVNTPGMAPLVSRVTLTLPVLSAAHEIVFLVTGDDKAGAVRRSFASPPDPDAPASLVSPDQGSLTVLLDADAASRLPPGRRSDSAPART